MRLEDLKDVRETLKDMLLDLPTLKELGLQDELDTLKEQEILQFYLLWKTRLLYKLTFGSLDFEKLMEIIW